MLWVAGHLYVTGVGACTDSSIFVYQTPVGFFWGGDSICARTLLTALCLCGFKGGQGLWMPLLGQLVETKRPSRLSLFLSRPSVVPQALGEVIWLGTGD